MGAAREDSVAKGRSSQFEALVDSLNASMRDSATGCLTVVHGPDDSHRLYFSQGELIAAHGPADGLWIVRRLVNNGAITSAQGTRLEQRLVEGAGFEELLLGRVPEDLLVELLANRFRQNIFDFITATSAPSFERMDAVFVDNIQIGHDSVQLVGELVDIARRTQGLRAAADELTLRPGPAMPQAQEEARLLDLCDPAELLANLLRDSPYEQCVTLNAVLQMLEAGALVSDGGFDPRPDEPEDPHTEEITPATPLGATRNLAPVQHDQHPPPPADEPVFHKPSDFDPLGVNDALVDEVEMAMFQDHDQIRGMGEGEFTSETENLDRVDLTGILPPVGISLGGDDDDGGLLEMEDAESLPESERAVALNFSGRRLDSGDVRQKIEVCNDVLAEVTRALDTNHGSGAGRTAIQLLLDGAPNQFSVLFQGIEADIEGRMDGAAVIKNLRRRPASEHRRLLNSGLMDLIERALSSSLEQLDDPTIDTMLERIAGYQQRLGL